MTSVLSVNGKPYIPATEAGEHFGYTKDYILLLAKQGKIEGQKINHKWYVYLPSAENFFAQSAKEKEARRAAIRKERKKELNKHQTLRTRNGYRTALLETLVIVVIGLSVGVTGYVGTTSQVSQVERSEYSFLEHMAISFYRLISPEDSVVVREVHIPPESAAQLSSAVGTTTHTSLVVAPDEVMTTTTVEDIRDSFSDEVRISVDPLYPDTGTIVPVFRDREGSPYRFLMVPVTEAKSP